MISNFDLELKAAWWRHTQVITITSSKFLILLKEFVPEYYHANFDGD